MSTRSLFGALYQHAELIDQGYSDPGMELPESPDISRIIDSLISNKIAWRPDIYGGVRLTKPVRELLDRHHQKERLRHLDADIGGRIDLIRRQMLMYINAVRSADRSDDIQMLLYSIREQVYELAELLKDNTRRLWYRVENDFMYVVSIEAKIAENNTAIEQAERLSEALTAINIEALYDDCGGDRQLRQLFAVVLQDAVSSARSELIDLLVRMRASLFKFQSLARNARNVRALQRFFQHQPGYRFDHLFESMHLPAPARLATTLLLAHTANVRNPNQEIMLSDMLQGLRRQLVADEDVVAVAEDIDDAQMQTQLVARDATTAAARNFFADLLSAKTPKAQSQTASASLAAAPTGTSLEAWIYYIYGEYQGMNSELRNLFKLEWLGRFHEVYDGNFQSTDIRVCLNRPAN
ncbi:MAG: hypothetical protein P1U47_16965 [Zhongshania sp.]|uniref:hypothetical protein n=1 Tax=Zhongshania sp. TaxID=1971902 RepID=UPI00260B58A7|nr:hypothetical protein [Zhongshania sp.]MDF1694063.1 hypothetical protein [Zhongshania sp.]